MTCQEYEPLIALYVEGDLEDGHVEQHLAACPDCRALLEDLRASQAALKDLAPVDAALLHAIRSGVLEEIGKKRRILWPWVAAFAAACAVIVAVLAPARKPVPIVQAPTRVVIAQAPEPVNAVTPAPGRKRARKPKPKAEPLVVKMLTDDPDIVIIWLVDQTGD